MNLKIREFKVSIENYINSADLPVEAKRMAVYEIYRDLEEKATAAIAEELKEREGKQDE